MTLSLIETLKTSIYIHKHNKNTKIHVQKLKMFKIPYFSKLKIKDDQRFMLFLFIICIFCLFCILLRATQPNKSKTILTRSDNIKQDQTRSIEGTVSTNQQAPLAENDH